MAPPARPRVTPRGARAGKSFGEHDLLRLIERAPDVVFRYRLQPAGYEYVSRAITRIAGFTPEELYADPASALKLVHRDDRAIVHDLLARGTGRVPIVVRWVRKDGSIVWVEQRNTPVFTRAQGRAGLLRPRDRTIPGCLHPLVSLAASAMTRCPAR